tara:strand:+ start:326 stop:604 length:279 start_codon:yes stop_codon:yes gene_type:complete
MRKSFEYRKEGFNCGVCKAQGKEQINQMRPMWMSAKYDRETKISTFFKDEDVTVTVPITSRFWLNRHKMYEHPEEHKEAEKKTRETRRRNSY